MLVGSLLRWHRPDCQCIVEGERQMEESIESR